MHCLQYVYVYLNTFLLYLYLQSSVLNYEVKEFSRELTIDSQFHALEASMTPLCRMPYDKQLNLKQEWTNRISKEMRSRLNKVKTPIRLPKIHPISPAVSNVLLKIT